MEDSFTIVTTLRRWAGKLVVEPGVLTPIINLLKDKGESMDAAHRFCVLSFDECSIIKESTYDKGEDILYHPKSKVQCAMLRGLVGSWKQPIFYDFDCDMSKETLFDIIHKVEAAGFPILAMVNDLGPTNVKLWNSLGIDINNTSFTNPASANRNIYGFADAPHLLKCIRNNVLNHSYELSQGMFVTSESVREIVRKNVSDLKITHCLSDKHVSIAGAQRMKVKLAAQLLSETTATALAYFGQNGLLNSRNWEATSNFIKLTLRVRQTVT